MRSLRVIGAALLAIVAFGAVSAVAQAEGPFFSKCKKLENPCAAANKERLTAGKTQALTSTGGTFVLSTASQSVTCTGFKANGGKFVGSEPGTAGTTEQTSLEFTGCTVKGNGEPCAVGKGGTGVIKTEAVVSTLTKENKTATTGEKLFVSFKPASGTVFVKIEFEGAGCKAPSAAVELSGTAKLGVLGVADLERACTPAEETEVGAELCKEKHAPLKLLVNEELGKKGLIFFPKTLLKTAFVEQTKVVSEVKEGLTFFGLPVTRFEGHANVEMTGVEDWGVFGA
jgi:hypothetical protein